MIMWWILIGTTVLGMMYMQYRKIRQIVKIGPDTSERFFPIWTYGVGAKLALQVFLGNSLALILGLYGIVWWINLFFIVPKENWWMIFISPPMLILPLSIPLLIPGLWG